MRRRRGGSALAAGAAAFAAAATLAAAACSAGQPHGSPGSSGPRAPATASRQALAARYLAIATAGNRRLEIDFDGLAGADRGNLARAAADLRDAAATERLFDRRLRRIAFPAATEKIAQALIWLNESRAALTAKAAAARTLAELRHYEPLLSAANAPVEQAVRLIRSQLGLPPPETS